MRCAPLVTQCMCFHYRLKTLRISAPSAGRHCWTFQVSAGCCLRGRLYRTPWWNCGPWCTFWCLTSSSLIESSRNGLQTLWLEWLKEAVNIMRASSWDYIRWGTWIHTASSATSTLRECASIWHRIRFISGKRTQQNIDNTISSNIHMLNHGDLTKISNHVDIIWLKQINMWDILIKETLNFML